MSVKLLFITPDYAKTIEYAARTSTATDCKENSEDFVRRLVKKGHLSVGRHCNASFEVICSRACSHQLVRHTHLNYTQESQRYVKFPKITVDTTMEDIINQVKDLFIIPPSVKENEKAFVFYVNGCVSENIRYHNFIEEYNIPKEDARYFITKCLQDSVSCIRQFSGMDGFYKTENR